MSKSKINNLSGLVYSTDPNFKLEEDNVGQRETVSPARQKLKIILDKKQRAGKAVTLITGFIGKENGLHELGKKLKTFCGTGGSVKDNEIIIQGDHRDKVVQWLQKNGYTAANKS